MMLFPFRKNREIPDELPNLASDELEKNFAKSKLYEDKNLIITGVNEERFKKEVLVEEPKILLGETTLKKKTDILEEAETDLSTSFFNDLQKNINKEMSDLDKLQEWYEKKFLPKDIVSDMREYWESQKPTSVLKVLGRNFKERLNEKISRLQQLEKQWQDIYFSLIEKEEEIKDEEQELKRILSEFVTLCKRKTGALENFENNGQRKEGKRNKKQNKG